MDMTNKVEVMETDSGSFFLVGGLRGGHHFDNLLDARKVADALNAAEEGETLIAKAKSLAGFLDSFLEGK